MENTTHVIGNEKHIVPQVDEMHSPRPSYETDEFGILTAHNGIDMVNDEHHEEKGLRAGRSVGINEKSINHNSYRFTCILMNTIFTNITFINIFLYQRHHDLTLTCFARWRKDISIPCRYCPRCVTILTRSKEEWWGTTNQ